MTNSLKRDLEPPRPRQPRDKVHIWGFACRRCGWHTTKWRGQTVVAQKVYFLCDYCARRNEAEFPDDKNHYKVLLNFPKPLDPLVNGGTIQPCL